MARLLTRIILSYRRGKHHLPFHNSHCLQFPDRRYDIRLLCHDLIDILVSKPALLGHIILLPLAEDNSLLFKNLDISNINNLTSHTKSLNKTKK